MNLLEKLLVTRFSTFVSKLSVSVPNAHRSRSFRYLLGVHDPTTNTLTLHSAPLHSLSPSVKSLKQLTAPAPAGSLMSVQRAALGAAFGTKKAIRALNAQARNKLDNESYGTGSLSTSLQSHLQSSITASASSLPTSAAIEHAANLSRPTIPPPNFDAKTPGEVYSINDIISSTELSTIDLTPFLKATNLKERNALIPFRRSKFIANHLRKLLPSRSTVEEPMPNPSKKDRERLQLVIHLSHLFAFRQFGGKDSNLEKSKMSEKLGEGVSPMLVDALLERYTEVQRVGNGQERRKVTGVMELKLLGYLLVVALRVDGWGTDVGILADDLGLGVKKYVAFLRSALLACELSTDLVLVLRFAGFKSCSVRSDAVSSLLLLSTGRSSSPAVPSRMLPKLVRANKPC